MPSLTLSLMHSHHARTPGGSVERASIGLEMAPVEVTRVLQGYLAHDKPPPPGILLRAMPRALLKQEQGYLAHKTPSCPLGPPLGPRDRPNEGV